MTENTLQPRPTRRRRTQRSVPRFVEDTPTEQSNRSINNEGSLSYWATLDKPFLLIVGLLLTLGAGMVFSTTFNWSLEVRGSSTAIFIQDHMRNVVLGLGAMIFFSWVDYRFWKRFAPLLLLITLGALLAVLFFGDTVFNAQRALINGRLQPGELAEFTIVFYMAAWLGAKRAQPESFWFGLVPFGLLLAPFVVLIGLQPDISTIVIILATSGAMYFVAGARIWHLVSLAVIASSLAVFFVQTQPYARSRVDSYLAAISNPVEASYHTQQVIISFVNGGWFGMGLGQSTQKFGILPAPHTDSIFAVIGEELGVVGAAFVVLLFIVFVMRGFQIARRALDPYGSLLAIGFTLWVAVQALLNVAVMTNVIPASGLPLPFISYGGSALLVTMVGVGLMLSVSRVATLRENVSNRRKNGATHDLGWGNGRTRLSRVSHRRSAAQTQPRQR